MIVRRACAESAPLTGLMIISGFGLNNKAKISGNMLEDEGVYGSIHFGFGSNITFGGKIKTSFHLDIWDRKSHQH